MGQMPRNRLQNASFFPLLFLTIVQMFIIEPYSSSNLGENRHNLGQWLEIILQIFLKKLDWFCVRLAEIIPLSWN